MTPYLNERLVNLRFSVRLVSLSDCSAVCLFLRLRLYPSLVTGVLWPPWPSLAFSSSPSSFLFSRYSCSHFYRHVESLFDS